MAESDIFVSNDIALDVDFGEIFVVDQGVVYKVIAEKYSSEKTYAVGDYVSHLEKLYRCITAVETAEAFDEEKWTEVFLADEVQIVNNNIALKANTADLAAVATSGSYNDLTNKPTIPAAQVNSDWNAASGVAQILNKPNLATVATSGSYNDLTGKPEIPAAQVQADYGQADSTKIDYIKNKPNLATVATSGNYDDLTNKPTIPAAQVNSDWEASSGAAQILNKPTIPTVNDATITVVQGSTTKGTFTLNQSADATITLDAGGGGGGAQVALTQAEYDALVQAGTVDPTVEYFITDGIPSSVEYYHIYSTDEKVVGTWIDGSTIYEKTFTVDNLSGNVNAWTNFTQLADVDKVINYDGCAVLNDGTQLTLGFYVMISYLTGNLRYFCKEIVSFTFSLRLTVRYTKATS